jgi:hypothetical protein
VAARHEQHALSFNSFQLQIFSFDLIAYYWCLQILLIFIKAKAHASLTADEATTRF